MIRTAREPRRADYPPRVRGFADTVLDWYDTAARDLPWRRPGVSAWAVLVSEIMLQQTPVARVLPAYEAWLARWPEPGGCAAAPAGEAVRMWGKLGYPRRALRLHEAARAITDRHGGVVPAELDELLALPGVGAYTARAVASFAYGRRHPVVDTNVRRVVARAVLGQGDAGPPATARDLAAVAALLPAEPARAARFGVASMELGALVCTARAPGCADCPVRVACAWRAAGCPPYAGPAKRPQRFAGTDRQVRGLLLDVLRGADGPVPAAALDGVWSDDAQRARALDGLVADGLVDPLPDGTYALPGGTSGLPGGTSGRRVRPPPAR
jgi:A/G-specific adenine glycosylase